MVSASESEQEKYLYRYEDSCSFDCVVSPALYLNLKILHLDRAIKEIEKKKTNMNENIFFFLNQNTLLYWNL